MQSARALFHAFLGGERRGGSTVYGASIVLTALTASYAAERHDPWKLVELVVTAVFVFWVAYVYANALSESIESRSQLSRPVLEGVVGRELGLLVAAVLPVLALLLGAFGVLRESVSLWLALAAGLAMLAAQGLRYAHVTGLGRTGAVAILVANLVLGLCVVGLKVMLVH